MSRTFSRPFAAAAFAVAAALTLAACGGSAEPAPTGAEPSAPAESATAESQALRIGFIPPTMSVPAFQGLAAGMEAIGEQFGDTVVTAEANFDPTTQLQTIQQWVKLGQIDALWVIPVSAETITAAITEALDKGIVVIAGGLPEDYGMAEGTPGITFSNVDNGVYGAGIGELMAACVDERLGGSAEVLWVANYQVQEGGSIINESALAAFAEGSPDSTIAQELIAKEERAASQTLISTALQAHPDVQGVFTGDAESTMAAVNALTAAGKDLTQLCVVGNGGTDEQKEAIDAGTLFGTVSFDFMGDTAQNMELLHGMAADPTAPGKKVVTPISQIRAEN